MSRTSRAAANLWLALGAVLLLSACAKAGDPAWAAPAPTATFAPTVERAATATSIPLPMLAPPTATPAPTFTPSPTVGPAPRLVQSYPVNGDRAVGAERPLVLVFDRAMDRASVKAAFALTPKSAAPADEVQFEWANDTRLVIQPAQPWQLDTQYEIALANTAMATDGAALAEPISLGFSVGGKGAPVPVLMYHHFAELGDDASQGQRDWTVAPQALQEQLDHLANHGWHTVSPVQLADYLATGAPLPVRPLIISIDDGYKEVLDVALPLFAATELRPVLFIVTDYVEFAAYLNWDELAELAAQGFMIGSHSVDHRDLRQADETEIERQIASSKALLEERLGVTVDAFCYPYGSLNQRAKQAVAESGYRTAYSLNPTIYQSPDEPLFLGRTRVDYGMTLEQFIELLPD